MKTTLLLTILAIPTIAGVVATRIWTRGREKGAIASRLSAWVSKPENVEEQPLTVLKKVNKSSSSEALSEWLDHLPAIEFLESLLFQAGHEDKLSLVLSFQLIAAVAPLLLAFALGLNTLFALVASIVLSIIPVVVLNNMAGQRRAKFCEQLPNAIDLMVAVLRSGHSIPQAVKAVASESPKPCGEEFEGVLQRLNLGQPLSDSLILSAKRFQSYELDLMRKAIAIQAEVGGSLAELLDKTNMTLRQRLKLAKQLKVITAQSRLSAGIVGMLPIVLAIALNVMSPGYMQMLVDDPMGRNLLCASIALEILGVYVMHKMSSMKV